MSNRLIGCVAINDLPFHCSSQRFDQRLDRTMPGAHRCLVHDQSRGDIRNQFPRAMPFSASVLPVSTMSTISSAKPIKAPVPWSRKA